MFFFIIFRNFLPVLLNLTVLGYLVNQMLDLHTHSTASDGNLSPEALIEEAKKRGLSTIALTDHDTIEGNIAAAKAAGEQGIRFIPGVELEIAWNQKGEFHLLGLGLTKPSPGFLEAIDELGRRRQERNLEIIETMNKAGINAAYDDVGIIARGHSIGRPHFAAFLVKRKIVKNIEQAFIRYLGKGKPFFIPKEGMEFDRAVAVIKESGGIAVLAHPMSLYISWGQLPDMVKTLKEKGLDGLEAWHPNAKLSSCRRLDALGKNLGLNITAGSDFHGEGRPDRKLGITAGGRKIDESLICLELPI
jgi:hypothetical protein